jgi:hypothetical protein
MMYNLISFLPSHKADFMVKHNFGSTTERVGNIYFGGIAEVIVEFVVIVTLLVVLSSDEEYHLL